MSAGPFEFLTAISFSFEYLLTNLLFVPFMSGASFNGDLADHDLRLLRAERREPAHDTGPRGRSSSCSSRTRRNVPIVQDWIDKWFWRGYRLLGLVAAMMDYMLPKKVMSWKEAFELYFEEQMLDGLFPDLEYYGIRPAAARRAGHRREGAPSATRSTTRSTASGSPPRSTRPCRRPRRWTGCRRTTPTPSTVTSGRRWERVAKMAEEGNRFFYRGLPTAVPGLPDPRWCSPSPGDPTTSSIRHSEFNGERFNTCSDGCKWIFDREPEKYVQAWLPVHQIYQGNCGGADRSRGAGVVAACATVDTGEYLTSADKALWDKWHAEASSPAPTPVAGA